MERLSKSSKGLKAPYAQQADPVRQAQEYGIDIAMLTANVQRTPAERIRRHQIALNTLEKLRNAKPSS